MASRAISKSLFRTNHFISPDLVVERKSNHENSQQRFENLSAVLGDGQFDDPDAMIRNAMASHGIGGVCQHDVDGMDTRAASKMNPADGWIEICGGKPCSDPFVRFDL